MKVYITKQDPLSFVQKGLKSITFWFAEPYFKGGRAIDDIVGPLEYTDYIYPRWNASGVHCAIDGEIIFKNFPKIRDKIWELIISTYNIEYIDEFDFYDKIADAYYLEKKERIPKIKNWNDPLIDQANEFENTLKIEKIICDIIEKDNWQEWVHELDLNLSIE